MLEKIKKNAEQLKKMPSTNLFPFGKIHPSNGWAKVMDLKMEEVFPSNSPACQNQKKEVTERDSVRYSSHASQQFLMEFQTGNLEQKTGPLTKHPLEQRLLK